MSYAYDAWGNFITTYHNGGASTRAAKNPFTYRGYYYDRDLKLYYLNSRYYDSVVGRFISPDRVVSDIGGDIRGYNLFVYCFNNPVNLSDSGGNWPEWVTAFYDSIEVEVSYGFGLGAEITILGLIGIEIGFVDKKYTALVVLAAVMEIS